MKHYKAVIIGASAKGIGIASQLPEQALILEPSSLVGREFIDALEPGTGDWTAETEMGKQLEKAYRKKKILREGRPAQIAAAAPVLFELVRDTGIQVLFATQAGRRQEEGVVTYYNTSGVHSVYADHIYSWEDELAGRPEYHKYLNALLYCAKPQRPPALENGQDAVLLSDYSHTDMMVLSYPLEKEDDLIQARDKLHRFWQGSPQVQCGWKIAMAASSFSWKRAGCETAALQPFYGNMLKAFESGVLLGEKWRKA